MPTLYLHLRRASCSSLLCPAHTRSCVHLCSERRCAGQAVANARAEGTSRSPPCACVPLCQIRRARVPPSPQRRKTARLEAHGQGRFHCTGER
eukprot:11011406-Lingulodinium_polyedra.AAC.1